MYEPSKSKKPHPMPFGREKISLQRNKIRDIYILTREIIRSLTSLKTSSKWFNLFVSHLSIRNIVTLYAPFMVILFRLQEKGTSLKKVHSVSPPALSTAHPQRFSLVSWTLPCDEKESTEVVWRELGDMKFQEERSPKHLLDFCNRLGKACEPLISLDNCSEDCLTMEK